VSIQLQCWSSPLHATSPQLSKVPRLLSRLCVRHKSPRSGA